MKTLLIRADASLQIGWGHVLRCLALAQAWQDAGGVAAFACAQLPDVLKTRLEKENCRVVSLEAEVGSPEDAAQTRDLACACGANWVICDGYNFGGDFLRALRCADFSLCAVDDLSATNLSAVDVILNPNAGATAQFYARFDAQQVLAGQQFALLRREFRLSSREDKIISPQIERVLVTMGGADINNLVPRVLSWLEIGNFAGEVVVLGGARTFDLPKLSFDVQIVNAQEEVPDWMNWCDIALATAGATTWELACCGVPAITSVVADNQRPLANWCGENGVAINTGETDEHWEERLESAWAALQNEATRPAMSARAQAAVDGQGAARAVQNLWPDALQLRCVTLADALTLWQWCNDERTRAMSLQSEPIAWETHLHWLDARLRDPDHAFWMAYRDGAELGSVRFARAKDEARISIGLSPDWRGRGLGTTLIQSACRAIFGMWNVTRIRAQVKAENLASRRAFEKAGFRCQTEGMTQLEWILERRP